MSAVIADRKQRKSAVSTRARAAKKKLTSNQTLVIVAHIYLSGLAQCALDPKNSAHQ